MERIHWVHEIAYSISKSHRPKQQLQQPSPLQPKERRTKWASTESNPSLLLLLSFQFEILSRAETPNMDIKTQAGESQFASRAGICGCQCGSRVWESTWYSKTSCSLASKLVMLNGSNALLVSWSFIGRCGRKLARLLIWFWFLVWGLNCSSRVKNAAHK